MNNSNSEIKQVELVPGILNELQFADYVGPHFSTIYTQMAKWMPQLVNEQQTFLRKQCVCIVGIMDLLDLKLDDLKLDAKIDGSTFGNIGSHGYTLVVLLSWVLQCKNDSEAFPGTKVFMAEMTEVEMFAIQECNSFSLAKIAAKKVIQDYKDCPIDDSSGLNTCLPEKLQLSMEEEQEWSDMQGRAKEIQEQQRQEREKFLVERKKRRCKKRRSSGQIEEQPTDKKQRDEPMNERGVNLNNIATELIGLLHELSPAQSEKIGRWIQFSCTVGPLLKSSTIAMETCDAEQLLNEVVQTNEVRRTTFQEEFDHAVRAAKRLEKLRADKANRKETCKKRNAAET